VSKKEGFENNREALCLCSWCIHDYVDDMCLCTQLCS
jgi:hypothetical protein